MIIITIVRIRSHLAAILAQQVMSLFDALHPADEDVDVGAGDGDGPDARGHDATTTAVWPIMKMDVDVGEHEQGAEDEHEQEAAVELAVTS